MDFEEEKDPAEICGRSIPPNLDCIASIPIPSVLDFYSIVFLSCSLFVILINALLVIYVLSKTPERKFKINKQKSTSKKAIFKLQDPNSLVSSIFQK